MAPSDDALDSGSSMSQETLAAVPHDSRDLSATLPACSPRQSRKSQMEYGACQSSELSASRVVWWMMVSAAFGVGGHVVCCA